MLMNHRMMMKMKVRVRLRRFYILTSLIITTRQRKESIKVARSISIDLMKLPATRRNALCMTLCWFAFSMGYFGLVYNNDM
mgnify:CR=1 FL=1